MNQNYNVVNSVSTVKTGSNINFIIFACMAVAIIGCFLPFLTVSFMGITESINYVYQDGKLLDGVYVIALLIIGGFTIVKGNYKGALGCIAIAIALFVYDVIDVQEVFEETRIYGDDVCKYGAGFYMIAVGLVGSLISSFIGNKNNKSVASNVTTVVTPVSGYVQPNGYINQPQPNNFVNPTPTVNNTFVNNQQQFQTVASCPYCGSPRNEGAFCKSCGGKY